MQSIYKYFKNEEYVKELIKKNEISFSRYASQEGQDELDIYISNLDSSFNLSSEQKEILLDIFKTHINGKNYMCCFSYENPQFSYKHWEKFSNNNGVCIEYELEDIEHIVEHNVLYYNKSIILSDVNYSDDAFDIADFVNAYISLFDGQYDDTTGKLVVDKLYGKLVERGINKIVTSAMCHKHKAEYEWENELRLIYYYSKDELHPKISLKEHKIKRVYITNNTPDSMRNFVYLYSKQKGYEVIEVNL